MPGIRRTQPARGVLTAAGDIFDAYWRTAPPQDAHVALIAHRAVHQTLPRNGSHWPRNSAAGRPNPIDGAGGAP